MDNSIWVWLILGAFFALAILKTHTEHRAYATAKEAYQAALAALADDPADTALRQDALRKGRALTAAGRRINAGAKTPRVSVHDELAIRNDLDAIQAGASHAPAGIADGLARLAALHREGVLTGQVADRIGVVIQAAFHDPGREDRIQSGLRATAPAPNLERITTTFFS